MSLPNLKSHQGQVGAHDNRSLQQHPAHTSDPPSPYGQACTHLWNLTST
jgi:hypothetical protein